MSGCMSSAARGNQEHILEWAREQDGKYGSMVSCQAAQGGHVGLMQKLYDSECPFDGSASIFAARYGQLEALQWLRMKGLPIVYDIIDYILIGQSSRRFEMIKWAISVGYLCNSTTLIYASKYTTIEVMNYLRDQGCPWALNAVTAAVYAMKIDNANWLIKAGCPYDKNHILRAIDEIDDPGLRARIDV